MNETNILNQLGTIPSLLQTGATLTGNAMIPLGPTIVGSVIIGVLVFCLFIWLYYHYPDKILLILFIGIAILIITSVLTPLPPQAVNNSLNQSLQP